MILADLARERERHLTTARAEQIPKYGQIRTESRLLPRALQLSSDVPVLLVNQPIIKCLTTLLFFLFKIIFIEKY